MLAAIPALADPIYSNVSTTFTSIGGSRAAGVFISPFYVAIGIGATPIAAFGAIVNLGERSIAARPNRE
jgi:hypothetical protein